MIPVIPVITKHPGLADIGDWKFVYQVPDTEIASFNGKHWRALLRLFTWQVQRVEELEAEVEKLKAAAFVPVPVPITIEDVPLATSDTTVL